jgi:serine/threonine-protein kinase
MAETADETQFGRLVVERRLATPEEVRAAIARQKELAGQGKRVRLAEVMIEEGYVTKSQLKRLGGQLDDSMTRPAQQIPGFQILGKLGAGAMATVFKARQLSLDRVVAVKVLPRRLSENKEFVERFYKEGRAAAQLNHNNIVQAIDVGEAGGYHYFVMEYVAGSTVYDVLAKGKAFEESDALNIILQIARALQHAHERGFIHRDVKPKNIMITQDGVAKLADMGLAREATDIQAAMAEAGRAYGTPYYISPEQIRGEVDIDFRADIYSLGATFYHMVTGRVPFDGPTPSAVMHKHLKEPLIPPDHINTGLSAGVGEVIELMMAKRREERYQNTRDLIQDLDAVARGEPPLQARQRYDANLLEGLADGERAGSSAPAAGGANQRPAPQPMGTGWTLPIILGTVLLASIVLNIVMVLIRP